MQQAMSMRDLPTGQQVAMLARMQGMMGMVRADEILDDINFAALADQISQSHMIRIGTPEAPKSAPEKPPCIPAPGRRKITE